MRYPLYESGSELSCGLEIGEVPANLFLSGYFSKGLIVLEFFGESERFEKIFPALTLEGFAKSEVLSSFFSVFIFSESSNSSNMASFILFSLSSSSFPNVSLVLSF